MRKKNIELLIKRIKSKGILGLANDMLKYVSIPLENAFLIKPWCGPILVSLIVTYRCNARCLMCNFPERVDKRKLEYDTREFFSIIDGLRKIGTLSVSFSGGEPLLRRDIFDLISYTKKQGMLTQMPTNGFLLNDQNIDNILMSGLDAITISLDSHNATQHDKIRRLPGLFDRAIGGVKKLIERRNKLQFGPVISLSTVINSEKQGELKKSIDFAKQIGVDNISFFSEEGSNSFGLNEKNKAGVIQSELDKLCELKKQQNIIDNSEKCLWVLKHKYQSDELPIKCYANYSTMFIDCYGDVFPCNMWLNERKSIQKIKGIDVKSAWRSKEYQATRKQLKKCRKCYYVCHVEINCVFYPWKIIKLRNIVCGFGCTLL